MTDLINVGFKVDTSQIATGEQRMNKFGRSATSTEKKVVSSAESISRAYSRVSIAIGAASSALAIDKLLDDIDVWTEINNRLRVVIDTEEQLIDVRGRLNRVAEDTRNGLASTVELYASIAKATKRLNVSSEEAIGITETLNNLFLAGGSSVESTKKAMVQLSQGLESGALRGDEFNSVAEQAPRLLDAISKSTGIARGGLREFAATGGITTKILINSIKNYSDEARTLARRTIPTLAQKIQIVKDNTIEWAGSNSSLSEASSVLGDSLVGLSNNIDSVVSSLLAAAGVWGAHLALVGDGSVLAYAKRTTAVIASEIASKKAIATTIAETEAEIALLNVQKAGYANMILRIKNEAQRDVIRKQLTTTTIALTAAESRLTVATTAQAAATTALGSAVRFLTGPWGLLLTAVGTAASVFYESRNASDDLSKSLDKQKSKIENLTNMYSAMTNAQFGSASIAARKQLISINSEILEIQRKIAETDPTTGLSSVALINLNKRLKELTKQKDEVTSTIDAIVAAFNGKLPTAWKSLDKTNHKISKNTSAYDKWIKSILKNTDTVRALSNEIDDVSLAMINSEIPWDVGQQKIKEIEDRIKSLNKETEKSKTTYQKWIDSISTTSTKLQDLRNEIDDTYMAMVSGDIGWNTGNEYVADLEKQIKSLSNTTENGFVNSSSEALDAIRNLAQNGSEEYEKLTLAIQAAATAQAILSGNYLGAAASVTSMLSSMFGEITADYQSIQAEQNINMWGEKSTAIADATETTAYATEKLVGINTDMLDALVNLTNAISSASGIITKNNAGASVNVGALGISTDVLKDYMTFGDPTGISGKIYDFVDNLTFGILGSIGGLLGGSSKVTDSGIKIIGDTLSGLIDDTLVLAYQTVKYKKWALGSTKTKTATADAGDAVSKQISLVFDSLYDAVYAGGKALGLSSDYLTNALNNFVVDTSQISLKGMSSEQQVEALNNYFSSVFNNLTKSTIPWLADFQKTGEELGDTLARVASEVSVLNYLSDNVGIAISATDASSIAKAADSISNLMGGYKEFADSSAAFIDAFATDAQKYTMYQNAMNQALSDVGLKLPSTTEGFYNLLSTIDASTDVGQSQIATLLSLTDTASAYYNILEDTTDANKKAAESYRDAAKSLYDVSFAMSSMSLDAALAEAKLGDFSLAETLDLNSLNPSKSDYANLLEYNLARAETSAKLNELADLTDGTATVSEQQLSVLEEIRDALNESDNSDVVASIAQTNSYLQMIAYGGIQVIN